MSEIMHWVSNQILFIAFFLCPGAILVSAVLITANSSVSRKKPSYFWILIPIGLGGIFTAVFFLAVVFEPTGFVHAMIAAPVVMASILSVFIALIHGFLNRRNLRRNITIFYFVVNILTSVSGGTGMLGSNILTNVCEGFHLQTRNIMVNALENYYCEKEQYPDNLSELVPQYLDRSLIHTCYSLRLGLIDPDFPESDGFYYKKCSQGTTELIIPEMGAGGYHVYDLNQKRWYIYNGEPIGEWGRLMDCQDGE